MYAKLLYKQHDIRVQRDDHMFHNKRESNTIKKINKCLLIFSILLRIKTNEFLDEYYLKVKSEVDQSGMQSERC